MGNPLTGKVAIYQTGTGRDIITLNADKADISVGGSGTGVWPGPPPPPPGIAGSVSVVGPDGTPEVSLNASGGGNLVLYNTQGKQYVYLGTHLAIGGYGSNAYVALFTPSVPQPANPQQATVVLQADNGMIRAGGAGADGNVQVYSHDTHPRIILNGSTAELSMFAPGSVSSDSNDATIDLNASQATMLIGGAKKDGKILVRSQNDKNDQAKIILDGASGDVTLSGYVTLGNADCAEDFDVADPAEVQPGAVMVFDGDSRIRLCSQEYDRKVAGIISGAGGYQPGIILDRAAPNPARKPLALLGKVFCQVDAAPAPIEIGDLLTTSSTPGHARKATDPLRAFGAVLGKALRPLSAGQGLVPVLVAIG